MKKNGVYDNSADLVLCSDLLSRYKRLRTRRTHSFTKTYPLTYNAYNFDEDSPSKKKNKVSKSSASKHDVIIEDDEKRLELA